MRLDHRFTRRGLLSAALLFAASIGVPNTSHALGPCDFLNGVAHTMCVNAQAAAARQNAAPPPMGAPPAQQGGYAAPAYGQAPPAPQGGYAAPAPGGYAAPVQGAPPAQGGYAAPAPGAQAAQGGYAAPQGGYAAPGPGAGPPTLAQQAPPARAAAPAAPARQVTVQSTPAAGPYRSETFSGLTIWRDIFDKAANKPQDFATFIAAIKKNATSPEGAVYGLVTGPKRNDYQKMLSDYEWYKLLEAKDGVLLTRQNECLVKRDYTPEEGCDCLAGFPGQTLIGPGAGELVTSSNHTLAIKACGVAADRAKTPAAKARYKAQQARAQMYTNDADQADKWADEAVAGGYKRAVLLKAMIRLHEIEVLAGSSLISEKFYDSTMNEGHGFLKTAKAKGVLETYLVAAQFKQVEDREKFNSGILTPIAKEMMREPTPAERASEAAANMAQVQRQRETGY